MRELEFWPDCEEYRPTSEFTRDRRRKDGLAFCCSTHARLRMRESRRRRAGEPKRRYPLDRVVPAGQKWCPDCDTVKPIADFPRTRNNTSGVYTYCKPCHNVRGKAAKDRIGGSRTYHLRRRYGISAGAQEGAASAFGEAGRGRRPAADGAGRVRTTDLRHPAGSHVQSWPRVSGGERGG